MDPKPIARASVTALAGVMALYGTSVLSQYAATGSSELGLPNSCQVEAFVEEAQAPEVEQQRTQSGLEACLAKDGSILFTTVGKNLPTVQGFSDIVQEEQPLLASQLFKETRFNPYLISTADAYGLGQLTEIAFDDTLYALLQVPGGFNAKGKPDVGTLHPSQLAKQGHVQDYQRAFADLDEDTFRKIDEVVDTISLDGFRERTQRRIDAYADLEDVRLSYVHDPQHPNDAQFVHKKEIRKIEKTKKSLRFAQEADNRELYRALDTFWEDTFEAVPRTAVRNRNGNLLWYQVNPADVDQEWVDAVTLLNQVNMRKEYGITDSPAEALHNYNPLQSYVDTIIADADKLRPCFEEK